MGKSLAVLAVLGAFVLAACHHDTADHPTTIPSADLDPTDPRNPGTAASPSSGSGATTTTAPTTTLGSNDEHPATAAHEGPADTAPDATADASAPLPADVKAMVDRIVAYLGQIADAVDAAQGDCKALVTKLNAVDNHEADEARGIDANPDVQKHQEQITAAYGAQMTKLAGRIFNPLQKCMSADGVLAALSRLGFDAHKKS